MCVCVAQGALPLRLALHYIHVAMVARKHISGGASQVDIHYDNEFFIVR